MTTPNLKRKPLPAPDTSGQVPTTTAITTPLPLRPCSDKSDYNVTVVEDGDGDDRGDILLPPSSDKGNYNITVVEDGDDNSGDKPLPPLPPAPTTTGGRCVSALLARNHWQRTSKRRRWIIGAALLAALLALIIGLSVGLSRNQKSHKKYDYAAATHQGDLTYYDPGLGACGITSTSKDLICALSYHLFDAASVGPNPNANPLCGRKLWFMRRGAGSDGGYGGGAGDGKRVEVEVVDRCAGCQGEGDLDVSERAFMDVAGMEEGRVGVVWGWVD